MGYDPVHVELNLPPRPPHSADFLSYLLLHMTSYFAAVIFTTTTRGRFYRVLMCLWSVNEERIKINITLLLLVDLGRATGWLCLVKPLKKRFISARILFLMFSDTTTNNVSLSEALWIYLLMVYNVAARVTAAG